MKPVSDKPLVVRFWVLCINKDFKPTSAVSGLTVSDIYQKDYFQTNDRDSDGIIGSFASTYTFCGNLENLTQSVAQVLDKVRHGWLLDRVAISKEELLV